MNGVLKFIILGSLIAFMVAAQVCPPGGTTLRIVSLLAAIAMAGALIVLARVKEASPIHKAMVGYVILTGACIWVWPGGTGRWVTQLSVALLYAVFFLMAAVPLILGREVFTLYFARKTTPEAVWKTDLFQTINQHLTGFWSALFFLGFLSALVPHLFGMGGWAAQAIFEGALPAALMVGMGIPITRWYPVYYQRKAGILPDKRPSGSEDREGRSGPGPGTVQAKKIAVADPQKMEDRVMSEKKKIVAINGSPHAGIGNTAMMIEMLREPLATLGFDLEVIHLSEHEIQFCTGCAVCLEKGKCWISDDHRDIVQKLLGAAGIVLASPVYFMHVTGQMKTFMDRCLAYGHKPRGTWKPGLAISVSSGLGETQTAQYLAGWLRSFGAFSVGTLTALATAPGGFIGKPHVEARAKDLAGDLARAIEEKRRFPATDMDLRFYQFMGNLVKTHKDTFMKDDDNHWQEHGLYDRFESYIQQTVAEVTYDPAMRDAWIKEMIARHKAGKPKGSAQAQTATPSKGPEQAGTCKELLQMMPKGFNPDAAEGLSAVYQFEISGPETFVAHLNIADGTCTYMDGPAEKPSVVVKSPADVWLAVSKGQLDGQQAFMSGKYQVEGDLMLLMRLKSLFSRR